MKRDKTLLRQLVGTLSAVLLLVAGGWLFMQCGSPKPIIRHVVLISIDSCRPDHLGCYGFDKKTSPHIDSLAAQGMLFEQVISPSPITLPAHASLFTGANPLSHGVHDNMNFYLGGDKLTLAEILKSHGFRTGAVISTPALAARFGLHQGFDFFQDDFSDSPQIPSSPGRPADKTTDLAVQWLKEQKDEKLFLFIQYHDPHFDYRPPDPYSSSFADDLYSGEIAFTDHCIGRLVSQLKELGMEDSTLLIITGDNGEMLGEHGESQHSYFIYESAIKVPLIVKQPNGNGAGPVRVKETVGLIDVAPTICTLLGIEIPGAMQGMSLVPLFTGKPASPNERYFYIESLVPTYLGANALLGVRTNQWKYILSTRPELYDLNKDLKEQTNLANTQAEEERILKGVLSEFLKEQDLTAPKPLSTVSSFRFSEAEVSKTAFAVDAGKPDAKDLIGLHEVLQSILKFKLEKKFPEARQALEELAKQNPHFKVYDYLGEIALDEAQYDQAVNYYTRSLELNPDGYHANLNMGALMSRKRKPEDATTYFKKAAEARPYDVIAPRNLGIVLEQTGNPKEACNFFFDVLMRAPNDTIAINHLGTSMLALGNPEEALRYFGESLKINRNQPVTLGQLAQLKITSPGSPYYNPAEAVSLAAEACRMTEFRHAELLALLVTAYCTAGQVQEAEKTAELAIRTAKAAGKENLVQQVQQQLQMLKKNPPGKPE